MPRLLHSMTLRAIQVVYCPKQIMAVDIFTNWRVVFSKNSQMKSLIFKRMQNYHMVWIYCTVVCWCTTKNTVHAGPKQLRVINRKCPYPRVWWTWRNICNKKIINVCQLVMPPVTTSMTNMEKQS